MITVEHHRDDNYYQNQQVWASRTIATSDDDVSPRVFVFSRLPHLSVDGDRNSFFLGIASVAQMLEVSENTSEDIYRDNTVDLHARDEDDREIALQNIDAQIDDLNLQLGAWDRLKQPESWLSFDV